VGKLAGSRPLQSRRRGADAAGSDTTNLQKYLASTAISYAAWSGALFTAAELTDPTVSGPAADPDHDGIPNLLEYAFGLDPKQADRSGLRRWAPRPTAAVNEYLTISYAQLTQSNDLTYTVQASTDMVTWNAIAPVVVSTIAIGSTRTLTVRDPTAMGANAARFLRVVVTGP